MRVDPADPTTEQPVFFNEGEDLVVPRDMGAGEGLEQRQDLPTISDLATCELADDERVREDLLVEEERNERPVPGAQMVDPDRGVDQRHATRPPRRLRIRDNRFSVPPSWARRRALSRAMSASSPIRTRAVFSEIPVSLAAWRRSASSMFRVVLMYASICHIHAYPSTSSARPAATGG